MLLHSRRRNTGTREPLRGSPCTYTRPERCTHPYTRTRGSTIYNDRETEANTRTNTGAARSLRKRKDGDNEGHLRLRLRRYVRGRVAPRRAPPPRVLASPIRRVWVRMRARRRVYLYIELNIRYIIHFKFFLLACPENVCITRTLAAPAHSRSPSLFLSLFLPLSLPFTPFRPPFSPVPSALFFLLRLLRLRLLSSLSIAFMDVRARLPPTLLPIHIYVHA